MPKEFISVLIPAYNEAENIEETLRRSIKSLDDSKEDYEILVIDDSSSDNTAVIARNLLGRNGTVMKRTGLRSFSLSVLDGIKQAAGTIIVVMDADTSHPPELILKFVEELRNGNDLIIASRYIKGGATENFPFIRRAFSRLGCLMGRLVTDIKDNTSGFFAVRKSALEQAGLTPQGFKIGLEIFVKARYRRRKEIPYTFVNRKKGKSKFSLTPSLQYVIQVFSLLIYKISVKRRFDKSMAEEIR